MAKKLMGAIADAIVAITKRTDGEKEKPHNSGFVNPDFEARLRHIGWTPPEPWCAATAIADWSEAYAPYPNLAARADRLYTLNSQQMGRNFHADPVWPTGLTPKVGAMAIYGDGDSTTSGHTGLVIEVLPNNQYRTEEGNTIPAGGNPDDPGNREGYIKAQHVHTLGQPHSQKGLNLIRFIYVMEVE